MSDKTLIKVIVRDTEHVVFEGDVDRISSFNEVGRFDIYQMHANFISIVNQEITIYKNHEKVKELKVEQAVMKVKKDIVHMFMGIEVLVLDDDSQNAPIPPKS